ncbi:MAG: GNAT family N-acetyltransferase [Paenisporosarcina sp.]|nr:GNAT family N-acetyltransferase [Paenisporosarcina sp.]
MDIRLLTKDENRPWDLLLLADPSRIIVQEYIKNAVIHVGEQDKKIIGVCVVKETAKTVVEIMNIAVIESLQGQGFGKQLIRHAIEESAKRGYAFIEIGTGNTSLTQLRLYQQCGFRIVGVDFDYFTRHYEKEIYENGLLCRDMIRLSYEL